VWQQQMAATAATGEVEGELQREGQQRWQPVRRSDQTPTSEKRQQLVRRSDQTLTSEKRQMEARLV